MVGSIFNMTNTVIGAGVLALPFAFRVSGFLLGNAFLTLICILGATSVYFIVQADQRMGRRFGDIPQSYNTLAMEALGKRGAWLSDAAMVALSFGSLTSYLVIIADLMQPFLSFVIWGETEDDAGDGGHRISRTTITLISLILLIPISSLKRMDALKFSSTMALAAICYMVILIVVKGGIKLGEGCDGCTVTWARVTTDFFRTIPIICFAFTCHMNILPIFNELENPNPKRYLRVGYTSHFICWCAYALVGTFGYLTFYGDTKSNIIKNYDADDVAAVIGRGAVSITVSFSYPMIAFPALQVLERVLFCNRPWNSLRHLAICAALSGLCVTLALSVDDISIIFGFTGALASTTLSFILPSLFYLKVKDDGQYHYDSEALLAASDLLDSSLLDQGTSYTRDRRSSLNGAALNNRGMAADSSSDKPPGTPRMRMVAWAMLFLGFFFMIASVAVTILEAVKGDDDDDDLTPTPTPAPTDDGFAW